MICHVLGLYVKNFSQILYKLFMKERLNNNIAFKSLEIQDLTGQNGTETT